LHLIGYSYSDAVKLYTPSPYGFWCNEKDESDIFFNIIRVSNRSTLPLMNRHSSSLDIRTANNVDLVDWLRKQ